MKKRIDPRCYDGQERRDAMLAQQERADEINAGLDWSIPEIPDDSLNPKQFAANKRALHALEK
jgi:hypothetical protein